MIYLIQETDTDYYKIGYTSRNLERRLAELQTGNPRRLVIVGAFEGGTFEEQKLHNKYAHRLTPVRNEWFKLSANDVKGILESVRSDVSYSSSNIGSSATSFRPIRRRQQHDLAGGGEDVPDRSGAVNFARAQSFQHVMRRKHKVSSTTVLGEEGQDGGVGD